jgi:hypothetical protein
VRTAPVVAEQFAKPPHHNSIGANVAILKAGPRAHRIVKDRDGNTIDHRKASVQQFMGTDTVFAGTPSDRGRWPQPSIIVHLSHFAGEVYTDIPAMTGGSAKRHRYPSLHGP